MWSKIAFILLYIIVSAHSTPQFQYANRQRMRGNQGKGFFEQRRPHPCEQSSCYPATGNLLIGRESQLYASSTCGLERQQRFCIVSHLEERKKCFWCDSSWRQKPNFELSHNVSNIVYKLFPGTKQKTWWQSENGKENVYIQLDMEAEFHFTHLIITFKTFRPAAMLIERSFDFGKTWQVYRYFAYNCTESFPGVKQEEPKALNDVICESRYSLINPLTDGEIIYRAIPRQMSVLNPYSEQVQNLLKMTNLRINFTKLHTLGDDLLDRREEIQEKYYYAINDMVVRGSCSCYGHANRCLPLVGIEPKPDMVHGRCECTHNTKGRNCEQCEDFFNDLPWRPALGTQTNACKRCNCNNHATSCHYDAALYEATGQVSGGVCDGCQHNTMGANCERCKPFYFRDPGHDIQDPEVCRPCDCDPNGSLEGGICDSITDESNGLTAGSCHCKTNVEGRRCDSCKNGFWNFTEDNPDGCEPCTCNTLGTVGNQGCNVEFGTCTCKRYVTGRNCDQCLPEFYGLSADDFGCKACDCDPGGSYDNNCDVISGQCTCRSNMTGRTCDTPSQQFFTVNLDYMLYEAEQSRTDGQVIIKEPNRDIRIDTWTGPGIVKVGENNFIEFIVDNIKTSTYYDTIIRYIPTQEGAWEDVNVKVIRPDYIDPNGPCADYNQADDEKRVALVSDRNSVKALPPTCLEAGKTYRVVIEFKRYSFDKETPSASVLIDSIFLKPRIESLPIFHGSIDAEDRLEEYTRYNCDQLMWNANHEEIPEICQKYHSSIGAYILKGAEACQCNPTGSTSKLCSKLGGYCTCKPNVVGRKCDQCAPGTYGFGPEGCKACDCNSIGALDNICNVTIGQCKCRANTYGRECNQCRTGFWNFPNCQRCDCNGHADICDSRTGACINCRDNTEGHYCENCVQTFYGDPRIGYDIPCRPCPCPGAPGSNHSYADNCSLHPTTKDVVCECKEGYAGFHCDVCSDNYYGNPDQPGGSCQPCDCNNKVDYLAPGNCDPHTGQCKKCLDNTAGDHCEVCRDGYFRYSPDDLCQKCNCFILGTNYTAGSCNPEGGQCICYPNVTGIICDECLPYHWKIASGEGCEPCGCDPQGSVSQQCNTFMGQCECKPEFGGLQCNECMRDFWGDPKKECKRCDCDLSGSKTSQCDMETGQCVCREGIGGYNCNTCARGYLGQSPHCQPCGECFDNWDRILQETRNNTLGVIDRAKDIKKVGATGAYTKEFDDMQGQLDEIDQLLNSTDDINVEEIKERLEALRVKINETEGGKLVEIEESLDDTREEIHYTKTKISALNASIHDLKTRTKELENNGTQLQEANVQGALTLIKNAKTKADTAGRKAHDAMGTINEADLHCKATENYLNTTEKKYKQQIELNKNALDEIRSKIDDLNEQIPDLNNLVCDGNGDPCDAVCGGAGCGTCGNSISCKNGAKQLAETAVTFANNTETILRQKESAANDFIRNVSHVNTERTRQIAQETFDRINATLGKSNDTLNQANQLLNDIKEFLAKNHTKPEELNDIIEKVLATDLKYNKKDVDLLARNIRDAVDRLTNTDYIIDATRDHLDQVNGLKQQALAAKDKSNKLLSDAEKVKEALNNTNEAQHKALTAIDTARDTYKEVEQSLNEIFNKTQDAQSTTSEISNNINTIKDKLNELQSNITDNGIFAEKIINESVNILKNAEHTQTEFNMLQEKYYGAKKQLQEQLEKVKTSKERASELIEKALKLGTLVTKTQEDIVKLESISKKDKIAHLENRLNELIDSMNGYNRVLEEKTIYLTRCTS